MVLRERLRSKRLRCGRFPDSVVDKIMKIKVLEVIRQGQVGGGESHLLDLVSGFRKEIEVVVLSFTEGEMIDEFRRRGVKCHVISSLHPFDPRVVKRVRSLVKCECIDLIHVHGSRAASNILPVAILMGKPVIYTVHGWSFHQDQRKIIVRMRALCEAVFCRMSSRVICVSESNRQSGAALFGLKNACVIENGVDPGKFSPDRDYKDIRKEAGIADDDFLVGLVGRMVSQKNPLLFIRAIEAAHRQEPKVKGLLVGEGDLEEAISAYITEHGLEKTIYRLPFRRDIPDILHALDIFCLPSLWEGLPISLLEAMSMGKTIVATPTDGTKEVIKDGVSGAVVPFGDAGKLADSILFYYGNRDALAEHGRNGRRVVLERFDSRRVSANVEDIYLEVVKNR